MKRRDLIITVSIFSGIVIAILAILLGNRLSFSAGHAETAKPVPLSATFPADFPVYPGAGYLGANQQKGQVDGRWYDRGWFVTHDDPQRMIDWYGAHLPEAGYAPLNTKVTGYSKQFSFPAGKSVVAMEVFPDQKKPTTFSVDFFPAPK